jgi:protein involved in polysaccharide export with SLBB domain
MSVRDLIMLAGGLDESALLTEAEIATLPESRANGVTATTRHVPLDSSYLFERGRDGKYMGPPGVSVPPGRTPEIPLKPYDAVSILRQPDFDYQRTVTIAGRVKYAGQYSLKTKSERLSDLIERAGGLASDAYPAGISFIRQRDSAGGIGAEATSGLNARYDRIGIDLPRVLKDKSDIDNILLVDKDSIFIPPYNAIVTVRGAVNSPAAAVAFVEGADINYYIRAAGGGNVKADERHAYVFQPNGKVETKRRAALVYSSNPRPQAGSVVVVPERDPNDKGFDWLAATQTTMSLLASLITVVVLVKTSKL